MFNFMKLGIHFSPMMFGAVDPMVLELIRQERLRASESDAHAEALAEARQHAAQDEEDLRKAA